MKQAYQDLKTEIEAIKKPQTKGMLYLENLGKQMGSTARSVTNRIQEIEERISGAEDSIEEIESLVKENNKSKNSLHKTFRKSGTP